MTTVATTRFVGFGGDGLGVLAGLREQNTRTYFETHRDTYREQVIEPATAFVIELADRLRPIAGPGLVAEPRVDGSVFRLHRDVDAAEPDLVRVPRPYPADHPRGEWLRRRRVILSRGLAAPSQLYEATLVEWCAQRLEPFAAMHRWLVRHVAEGA